MKSSTPPPKREQAPSDDITQKMLRALEMFAARTGNFADSVQGSGLGNAGSVNITPGEGSKHLSVAGDLAVGMTHVGKFANAYGVPLPSFFPAAQSVAKLASLAAGDTHDYGTGKRSGFFGDTPSGEPESRTKSAAAMVSSVVGSGPAAASTSGDFGKLQASIDKLNESIQMLVKALGGDLKDSVLPEGGSKKKDKSEIEKTISTASKVKDVVGGGEKSDSEDGGGKGDDMAKAIGLALKVAKYAGS